MAKTKKSSESSEESVSQFRELADHLQQTRRNQKLSVKKVAQMSSLPDTTIRALENPTRSKLPKSNVAGLYRVYASALEIPQKQVNKFIGSDSAPKPEFRLKQLPKLRSMIVFSRMGVIATVTAIIAVIVAYAAWQGVGLVSSPDLVVTSPEQSYLVIDQSSYEISGTAHREATVLVNGEPVTVSAETGEFSQLVYLQRGYNQVRVEVVNSFSSTTVQDFVIIYEPNTISA